MFTRLNLFALLTAAACLAALLPGARPPAAAPAPAYAALDIPITVKENAEVGAAAYPISAVIPLPQGVYTDPAVLGMAGIPSQVEVLERWPGDGSLRHVQVHFQVDLAAHGSAVYHFTAGGQSAPPQPVLITDTTPALTLTTGPLKLVISKIAFNLLDQAWLDQDGNGQFDLAEQVIASDPQNGGVFVPRAEAGPAQYDSARAGLSVQVEESGPMRAVVRVEAPARFITTTQHTHGFAARIYAYAGQPFVKIDYQLQNSDKTVVRSWPLYFEEQRLDYRLALQTGTTLKFGLGDGTLHQLANTQGAYLAQERHNRFKIYDLQTQEARYDSGELPNGSGPDGFVDVSDAQRGVMAAVRNFWETWPNGLQVDSQNRLSVQLFPPWGAQWYEGQLSPSGLYWLEDMQHYYKETLLYFHGPGVSDASLVQLARTFHYYPTPVLPIAWRRQAQADLGLGGVIPPDGVIPPAADQRQPVYAASAYDLAGPYYGFGWINFRDPEPGYRTHSCTTGGWPYSAASFIATGSPSDYFAAEGWASAEVNLRPEWLAGYTHAADWETLRITENPYCGGRWRLFEGHGISKLAAPPLPGTGAEDPVYYARDDQHGWFYHLAEAYWLTGSPWLKDWYAFIAQFRRVRLGQLDPWPDTSSRATGHALNHALQAGRVAGDAKMLDDFGSYLRRYLRPQQDRFYGDQLVTVEQTGGGFQTGYLMRAVIDYLEEVRAAGDWQAYAEGFSYLSGLVEWNYNYGHFPYYFDARGGGVGTSSGTGLTMVDPQAWYYWHTGRAKYWQQLQDYINGGISGGNPPYGEFNQWQGQYEGCYYLMVKHTPRPDKTPPPAITDLQAEPDGSSTRLAWTAPAGAARYLIVWSTRPITASQSLDSSEVNWWAAHPVGPDLAVEPGSQQSWTVYTGGAKPVYAAIFSFDQADNLSQMSNLALSQASTTRKLYLPAVKR